jgi:hypothetical protein
MKHPRVEPYITHCGNWDALLTRVGQRLFIEWRRGGRGDRVLEAACESVWSAKREFRASRPRKST